MKTSPSAGVPASAATIAKRPPAIMATADHHQDDRRLGDPAGELTAKVCAEGQIIHVLEHAVSPPPIDESVVDASGHVSRLGSPVADEDPGAGRSAVGRRRVRAVREPEYAERPGLSESAAKGRFDHPAEEQTGYDEREQEEVGVQVHEPVWSLRRAPWDEHVRQRHHDGDRHGREPKLQREQRAEVHQGQADSCDSGDEAIRNDRDDERDAGGTHHSVDREDELRVAYEEVRERENEYRGGEERESHADRQRLLEVRARLRDVPAEEREIEQDRDQDRDPDQGQKETDVLMLVEHFLVGGKSRDGERSEAHRGPWIEAAPMLRPPPALQAPSAMTRRR